MRVSSDLSNTVRVSPQQDRSTRRLAGFLDAAAELFAEVGYEATTMTAIAERSGSGIGTLYHYFPDKVAVALALVGQYGREIEDLWGPLMEQAVSLNPEGFAERFIERITKFNQEHPAYLALVSAPVRFRRDPAAKRAMRVAIAQAFQAKNPALSEQRAMLAANVSLQIVRGMTTMYTEASAEQKPVVVAEFKRVLTLYLGEILSVR